MIGQFVDTMIVALTDRVIIMTHQTLSLGKYRKLVPSTLIIKYLLQIISYKHFKNILLYQKIKTLYQ